MPNPDKVYVTITPEMMTRRSCKEESSLDRVFGTSYYVSLKSIRENIELSTWLQKALQNEMQREQIIMKLAQEYPSFKEVCPEVYAIVIGDNSSPMDMDNQIFVGVIDNAVVSLNEISELLTAAVQEERESVARPADNTIVPRGSAELASSHGLYHPDLPGETAKKVSRGERRRAGKTGCHIM